MSDQVPDQYLLPISALADHLGVPLQSMRRWSDSGRNNGFPAVAERLGRVKFYDVRLVERWYSLWSKTGHMKNGTEN